MKKISERNKFPKFDLLAEYKKIEYLLSEHKSIYRRRYTYDFTIEEIIGISFLEWHLRGTFISTEEMRAGLGIKKEELDNEALTVDSVLAFLQYAANCAYRISLILGKEKYYEYDFENSRYLNALMDNIHALMSHLGAELSLDEGGDEVFIMYSNAVSDVVSVQHPDVKDSISEYLRIDNRNDLKRKGEILCTLYKKLESVETRFKGTEFSKLIDDATFLYNTTGIRHWVENDKIAAKTFEIMSDEKKETWYDKTFELFITCMAVLPYSEIKREIKAIKKTALEQTTTEI